LTLGTESTLYKTRETQARVVRKPVSANPGLKVRRSDIFFV